MSHNAPADSGPSIAVIIPVLNEADRIEAQMLLLCRAGMTEIVVVDGGSTDDSVWRIQQIADAAATTCPAGCRPAVLHAPRGRAPQMNVGARAATADVLLFVHADTRLPSGAGGMVQDAIRGGHEWGRFDICLDGPQTALRIIERAMNWRSALTGIVTGDQALFVRRDIFMMLGGFAPIALMEDIELSHRLRVLGRPARIRVPVVSSSRRWHKGGLVRTVLLMWSLRLLYWLGVAPDRLARFYGNVR